eukprot:TRINITY_DN5038_c0_g4_i1.p2 TRINITY_DN5038_c0_g4~~TRINITY_DN5038_c0_g4_i1.p2  ORF type:complete len:211 (+),score=48.19 TRINITY_DN5038_c0_g4_i1:450-1082(+)
MPWAHIGCRRVSDSAVGALVQQCPKLLSLRAAGTPVGAATLEALAAHCVRLAHLDLGRCRIPADTLVALGNSKVGGLLRTISLAGCSELSARCLESVFAAVIVQHTLHTLDLSKCQVSDALMHTLLGQPSQLVHLNISDCSAVTDAAFLRQPAEEDSQDLEFNTSRPTDDTTWITPTLRTLNIRGCSVAALTYRSISSLLQTIPLLDLRA